jgi:FKBP-type peptidyl-prolyl cis-trans isomerase
MATMLRFRKRLVVLALATFGIAGCKEKESPPPQQTSGPIPQPIVAKAQANGNPTQRANSTTTPFPPPETAVRTPSGLLYEQTRAGVGDVKPERPHTVQLAYTAWKSDGVVLDTRSTEQPLTVEVRRLTAGLAEAILDMRPGEKRRLWVPWEQAKGLGLPGQPALLDPPYGDLTVDVELLGIVNAPDPLDAARLKADIAKEQHSRAPR